MYRDVAFMYCLVCQCFKSVRPSSNSTLCRLLKVLPSPLLLTEGWMKRSRLHGLCLLYAPHVNQQLPHPPDSSAKNAFSISSPDLRELLWTPTVFSGLLVLYRPKLRRLFINCHTSCPQSMPLPKTVPISVCAFHSVPTVRFANISLQASPTFRRSQRGHNMEVWTSIDVVLLLGRAQMSTKKYTSRNYFCKLFLTSRYGRFMDFVKLPRPATALNKLLELNISPIVFVGWKSCLVFLWRTNLTNIYVEMDIYSSVFKPMVYNSSDMHEDGKKGVSSGLVLRIVWTIIIDVIRF